MLTQIYNTHKRLKRKNLIMWENKRERKAYGFMNIFVQQETSVPMRLPFMSFKDLYCISKLLPLESNKPNK